MYLFLHRLPRELWVLLTEVDHSDGRVLVDKADQLRHTTSVRRMM
jgi:hypothetical protein